MDASTGRDKRRDDAARAAWLYFVRGRTQDEIAAQLELSRQAVQRLVAFSVSEKLIKFRLDHPIAACMELSAELTDRFGLEFCDVSPSDRASPGNSGGVAAAVADRIGRLLAARAPVTICVGTGRTLRAAVEEMETLDRPEHKIISLVGAMSSGGLASPYDVVMRLGDTTGAQRFPMPAPVVAETEADRAAIQSQRAYEVLRELRAGARASFVGISEIAWGAPIHKDGFLSDADIASLVEAGAIGEVTGWSFDSTGQVVDSPVNRRVASLDLEIPPARTTVIAGCGPQKVAPIRAALTGGLCTALITDEATAAAVLQGEG
jgi:DNA-binding transcriptional regulator LsrR (DeoR family)